MEKGLPIEDRTRFVGTPEAEKWGQVIRSVGWDDEIVIYHIEMQTWLHNPKTRTADANTTRLTPRQAVASIRKQLKGGENVDIDATDEEFADLVGYIPAKKHLTIKFKVACEQPGWFPGWDGRGGP